MQLGEGGYSFVYRVREVPTVERLDIVPEQYALKKVQALHCRCLL